MGLSQGGNFSVDQFLSSAGMRLPWLFSATASKIPKRLPVVECCEDASIHQRLPKYQKLPKDFSKKVLTWRCEGGNIFLTLPR